MSPRRPPSPVLPAAVGAAAALLALSTLGLTWLRRSVEGPLGDAGTSQVEQLSGRDVAPVVTALVPGVAAVVVVGLLLPGLWRALALAVAAVGAGVAAVSAAATALDPGPDGTTTAVPLLSAVACLVVAGCAGTAAVLAARGAVAARRAAAAGVGPDQPPAVAQDPADPAVPADLWRELDEGRDPTGSA